MKPSTQRWLKGIGQAFIGGGSGAAVSSLTTAFVDPDKFNPMKQTVHFFALAGAVFLVSGLVHLLMFLQQHPLPDDNTTIITKP